MVADEELRRAALESGRLSGNETIKAKVTLRIEGLEIEHEIDGEIALS